MTTDKDRHAAVASRVADIASNRPRTVIAVAGPPASGKSTFAEELAQNLNDRGIRSEVVPMDGFHLDNSILRPRGLFARKGAPETFDAAGFVALVQRLKLGETTTYPRFDRQADATVPDAGSVSANCAVVVVEGNYLLFDEPPWRDLSALWDFSIQLDVPLDTLRDRLVQRWRDHGMSDEAALARAEKNDLPNARRVRAAALPADVVIPNAG